MKHLLLEYDESVDAAYLVADEGTWHHQQRLDDARAIKFASDRRVLGIEILAPRRSGVLLDGLPYPDDIARVMRAVGFSILETAR